jgi:hypothetical protein
VKRLAILFAVLVVSCSGGSRKDKPDPVPAPIPAPLPTPPAKKKLILHPHPGQDPNATPEFIKANLAFLKSLPFDGLSVYMRDGGMNVTASINTTTPVTIERIRDILEPVRGMKDSFAFVLGSSPPDFFHDWTVVVENWRRLAVVCREVGLAGILFDNEQYAKAWGNWIEGEGRTLEQAQAQAVVRGAEVMRAVVSAFPSIAVIHLHGPSVSRFDAPAPLFPQWQSHNELLGPFFAGQLAGRGTATVVDGGEIYHLRTFQQFDESYKWRKKQWPNASISFGVYDLPDGGAPMNPEIMRTTIANALKMADGIVWMYPEAASYLLPTAPAGMLDAIRMARKDAGE